MIIKKIRLSVQKPLLFRSLPTICIAKYPAILLRSHANRGGRLTSAGSGVANSQGYSFCCTFPKEKKTNNSPECREFPILRGIAKFVARSEQLSSWSPRL
eukprot:s1907_g4.t1